MRMQIISVDHFDWVKVFATTYQIIRHMTDLSTNASLT